MTQAQWNDLLRIIRGEKTENPPIGFIIDSPWLPGWVGCDSMDYYTSDKVWFDANMRAINMFPDATFVPGFWSEYGEINEPSAFGSKLVWMGENLPHAEKTVFSVEEAAKIEKPNVKTDGLLPLMLNRLKLMEPEINKEGHQLKFAIARGPFNIASFLMGTSEFMLALMLNPEEMHQYLRTISDFTIDWLRLQKETFPSIEGIMILDDLIGFVGEPECANFAVPYLKDIYSAFDSEINFFHNDADGLVVAAHLDEIGVHFYNFSYKYSMLEMREACGPNVTLFGNIPPRDVLSIGTPDDVRTAVNEAFSSIDDHQRIMWSAGGGVPQGVSSENLKAFIDTVYENYS
jgi:uroporphyrinogen-III decarboxylase